MALAVTLKINAVDRSDLLLQGSATVSMRLNQRWTASFTLRVETGPYRALVGQSVEIKEDTKVIFLGTIDEITEERVGVSGQDRVFLKCLCTDLSSRLDFRIASTKTYLAQTAGSIVRDAISTWATSEGITAVAVGSGGYVADGATVSKYVVDHQSVSQIIADMCSLSGYVSYVDTAGHLHFAARTAQTAPYAFNYASLNFKSITTRKTREDYYNESWTRISWQAFAPTVETFHGNSSTRTWNLAHEAAQVDSITLNGTAVDFGGEGEGRKYTWHYGEKKIDQDSGETLLVLADNLVVAYRELGGDWIHASDSYAISDRVTVEGNSGHYGRTFESQDQTNATAAQDVADGALRTAAIIPTVAYIETIGSWVQPTPGDVITISVSTPVVSGTFLAQEITARHDPNAGCFVYAITALDGTRIGNWIDYFKALANQGVSNPAASGSGTTSGGGGASASAPNIGSATAVQYDDADTGRSGISGTITLPTSDPNYSHLQRIEVAALGPGSDTREVPLATLYAPWGGTTVDYKSDALFDLPDNETWHVEFRCTNEDTVTTAGPLSVAISLVGVGDVTLGTTQYEEVDKGQDGWYLRITQPYTPPSPIRAFAGVDVEVEAPDQTAQTQVETLGSRTLGTVQLAGAKKPLQLGQFDYDGTNARVVFEIPRPTFAMTIRVRLISYSVQFVKDSATAPTATFSYTPSDLSTPGKSGIEFADPVTGYSVSTEIKVVGGVSMTYVYAQWTKPALRKFSGIYHVVEYVTADGDVTQNVGVMWRESDATHPSNVFPTPPAQNARCWALSYANPDDGPDRVNTYAAGVTPEATLALGNPVGSTGTEYADNVTGLAASVVQKNVGGVMHSIITTTFTRPVDARWYGVYVGVTYTTDDGFSTTNWGVIQDGSGALGPSNDFPAPNSVQSVTLQARSYAVIEGTDKVNTSGPSITISIGTTSGTIEGGSVKAQTIAQQQLLNAQIIDAARIVDAAVQRAKLAALAVDNGKLDNLAVDAAKLANSAVTATKIASLAVGTAAIAALAVTNAQIANGTVGTLQIANAAIDNSKIANLAVDGAKIQNATIGTAHIQNLAITNALIANLAVDDAKISSLSAAKITGGTISASITMTSPTLVISSGSITVNIDSSNYVLVTNSAAFVQTQQNYAYFRVQKTNDAFRYTQIAIDQLIISGAGGTNQSQLTPTGLTIANQSGQSTTISFTKPGGATGTMTFTGGILTANT